MSCPDAVPSQKNGETTSSAVAKETPTAGNHFRRPALPPKSCEGSRGNVISRSCHCNRSGIGPPCLPLPRSHVQQLSDTTRAHEHFKHLAGAHHRSPPTGEILSAARRQPLPGHRAYGSRCLPRTDSRPARRVRLRQVHALAHVDGAFSLQRWCCLLAWPAPRCKISQRVDCLPELCPFSLAHGHRKRRSSAGSARHATHLAPQ